MDGRNITDEMKNANTADYKRKLSAANVGKMICTFIVFPLTLVLFISGGFYAALDAVSYEVDGATPEANEKSVTAKKNTGSRSCPALPYEGETEEETEAITAPEPVSDEDLFSHLYDFDRSAVPDGKYGIIPLSMYKPVTADGMYIKNSSGIDIDYRDYENRELSFGCGDGYTVLIIHTHGTESYVPEGVFYTDKGFYPRSDDKSENVVGIGDVFEAVFEEAGIKTLHCEIPIDKTSYSKAYHNAEKIIKEYIKEYPSIKYIFDIHRDSVDLSSGEKVKAVTVVNGKTAAQIMFVIGTDAQNKDNANWGDNFAFAIKLQLALNQKYREFVRPINLKQGDYNQYYAPLSLLIEVGCDGNTFEEAEYSAKLTAEEIVHIIKGE